MAYQGADQLRRFGAEIYTVNLLGISILREIGILLTAIIIAGRSGSAFTAQIGTMKVNQEIDALRTLGLDPIEVLVLPRLLALMLALPLLAFFADMLALLGGAPDGARWRSASRPASSSASCGERDHARDLPGRPRQGAGVRLPDRAWSAAIEGLSVARQRRERRPADHPLGGAQRSSW